MFAVPSFFLKKKKENEATVLFSKTKMTLERFHGKALQKETTPVQTKRDMERRKMFQQKASTRRTVRGSTDSDWCCTVRFVVILIYLLLLLPKRNENYLCKREREKRRFLFLLLKLFPEARTFPSFRGGTSSHHQVRLRLSCLPQHRGDIGFIPFRPAAAAAPGKSNPDGERSTTRDAGGMALLRRPPRTQGRQILRTAVRGQKSEAASRFHFRDGKKGAVPVRRLAASASNRHEKEKAGSTKTKRGVCDVPIGGETLTITHRGHVSPTVLLFLGVG
jgi:hypothetical protein